MSDLFSINRRYRKNEFVKATRRLERGEGTAEDFGTFLDYLREFTGFDRVSAPVDVATANHREGMRSVYHLIYESLAMSDGELIRMENKSRSIREAIRAHIEN